MRTTYLGIVSLSALLGMFLPGCHQNVETTDGTFGLASQALSQADIIACTGTCAEAFGGQPSSMYPVYLAWAATEPSDGGAIERVVAAAFLMKCGANTENAARTFGYDPRLTSEYRDRLESFDSVDSLLTQLGGMFPVVLDCASPPFVQVFRRIDASHSATTPAYYVQLRQELIEAAKAKTVVQPPAIYGLDCANPLELWERWTLGKPIDILGEFATPINAAVLAEWTQNSGHAVPTIACGSSASYRIELPVNPPSSTQTATVPANAGAELYYVRRSFEGATSAATYYLISNGLGYAIDGCGANIGRLVEALGMPADTQIAELSTSDPKFTQSLPDGQPVLHCSDAAVRVIESINAPRPYRYFSFGSGDGSTRVRFACIATERFFLDGLSVSAHEPVPEESLPFLSGSGSRGRTVDIGCVRDMHAFKDQTVNGVATGDPLVPRLGMAPWGAFVAVWEDDASSSDGAGNHDIIARGFAEGGCSGAYRGIKCGFTDLPVAVAAGNQQTPAIAVDGSGNFVVVWADDEDGNGAYQIHGRGFDANGNQRIPRFTVNSEDDGQQVRPEIAMAANGQFVVVWEDDSDDDGSWQLHMRAFTADGAPRFVDRSVHLDVAGNRTRPAVAMNARGNYVVAWQDDTDGNDIGQIHARGFKADGSELFARKTVNREDDGDQRNPTIGLADNADFVVAWEDDPEQDGAYVIKARGFDTSGSPRLDEFLVHPTAEGDHAAPRLAMRANGDFALTWQDDEDGNGWFQIHARSFRSNGAEWMPRWTVNQVDDGQQVNPHLALNAAGTLVVIWEDDMDDDGVTELLARGVDSP